MARKSTTLKMTKKNSTLILNWIKRNAPNGVIIRHKRIEYGIVEVNAAGDFVDAEGKVLNWRECTIPRKTVEWILNDTAKITRLAA